MQNARRRARILLLIALLTLLACTCYILAESGHDCIGANCPVCAQLNVCRSLLQGIVCMTGGMAVALVLRSSRLHVTNQPDCAHGCTLTALKVKLSN